MAHICSVFFLQMQLLFLTHSSFFFLLQTMQDEQFGNEVQNFTYRKSRKSFHFKVFPLRLTRLHFTKSCKRVSWQMKDHGGRDLFCFFAWPSMSLKIAMLIERSFGFLVCSTNYSSINHTHSYSFCFWWFHSFSFWQNGWAKWLSHHFHVIVCITTQNAWDTIINVNIN